MAGGHFLAEHYVEVVLAYFFIVGKEVSPGPELTEALLLRTAVLAVVDCAELVCGDEVVDVGEVDVVGVLGAELEALEELDLGIDVGTYAALLVVVLEKVRETYRVALCEVGIFRTVVSAVDGTGGNCGRLLEGYLDEAFLVTGEGVEVLVGTGCVEACSKLEPGTGLDIDVGADGHTVESGAVGDTVLVEVTCGKCVGGLFVTAADGEVVLLHRRGFEKLPLPVGSCGQGLGNRIFVALGGAAKFCEGVIVLGEHRQVHKLKILGHGLYTGLGVEVDVHAAGLAALGGDDDDTVGTLDTIDSGCGSILQDVHGLDIVRVDGGQCVLGTASRLCVDEHAVDDDHRFVGRVDGVDTTDADGRTAARHTGVLRHLHTGRAALEYLVGGGGDGLGDSVRSHGRYGSGKVALLDGCVADGYCFFEEGAVVGHCDVDDAAFTDNHPDIFVSEAVEIKGLPCGSLDGVGAVDSRRGSCGCPLHHYDGRNDRLTVLVGDNALDRLLLSGRHYRQHQQESGAEPSPKAG